MVSRKRSSVEKNFDFYLKFKKLFSPALNLWQNKLECLSLASIGQVSIGLTKALGWALALESSSAAAATAEAAISSLLALTLAY